MSLKHNDPREKEYSSNQKKNNRTPQNEERRNKEDHTVLKRMNGDEENCDDNPNQLKEVVKEEG